MYPSYQQKILFSTQLGNTNHYYEWENQQLKPILQIPAREYMDPAIKIGQDSIVLFHWFFDASKQQDNRIQHYYNGKLHHEEKCKDASLSVYQFETNGQSYWGSCLGASDTQDDIWQLSFIVNGEQTPEIKIQADWKEQFVYNQGKIYTITENALKIYNADDAKLIQEIPIDLELSTNYRKLFMDNEGNIWWSSKKHIYHIHLYPMLFELGLQKQNIPFPTRGIIALDSNRTYVAGRGSFFESPDWKIWSSSAEGIYLNEFHLTGVIQDKYNPNLLWWATEYHGLVAFDLASHRHEFYPFKYRDKHTLLWKPYQDEKGNIWVGAGEGMYRLDLNNRKYIPFGKGEQDIEQLQRSSVFHFYTNEKGTWLCTSTGLYLVDLETEKILQHYNAEKEKDNYIPSSRIAHLQEDSEGIFWLATKGDGLIKWNPKTGTAFSQTLC